MIQKVKKFKEIFPSNTPKPEDIEEEPVLKGVPKMNRDDINRRETLDKKGLANGNGGDDDDDDVIDLDAQGKGRKMDADDDLDKDSRFYGRKDCIKL